LKLNKQLDIAGIMSFCYYTATPL